MSAVDENCAFMRHGGIHTCVWFIGYQHVYTLKVSTKVKFSVLTSDNQPQRFGIGVKTKNTPTDVLPWCLK
jgi:hypothetical protein